MDDGGRSTLTTLMELKVRRERNIRAALALLDQREAALLADKAALLDERRTLWNAWRTCSTVDRVHDHASLQLLKHELAGYHHRDQTLVDRVELVDAQCTELRLERDQQRALLRRAQIDHEKLKTLLE
ncbi:hypothetical protein WK92_01785 [Burkholderia ubonensis]|uniref:hypothetical protein n=2 Tax=Burkholderia ubonensis TaxID=101571 RepID=UPI00075771AB|nr:hypothetical protein [Burkholderia ubonensis]KVV41084.1 hypothetical protein WK82_23955 [Burkholderia ubonensis]KVW14055.1 hypothetical protein WK92_01785 [Burkholderia ubonensis]KVW47298.1 hypothetical protein WK95_06235 [Burkholderia ubonensis]